MIKQWGKNPEYTLYLFHDLSYWALPLCIYWWGPNDAITGIHFALSIKFLCFGFEIEIWRWKEKPNKLTQKTFEKSKRGEDLHRCDDIDQLLKELNDEKN